MKLFVFALLAFATVAPAQEAALPPPEPVAQPPAVPTPFDLWVRDSFRPQALAAGVSAATLDRELAGLTFNPRMVQLDTAQPDRSATSDVTFAAYLRQRLNTLRINRGRALASDMAATLGSLEAKHGVPGPLLLGIWGMETSYGERTGNFDLLRSVLTLAFEGRRRALFTREAIAALKMLESGAIARHQFVGSWAGATGQPQFLPSSYLAYAADGDGDGRADIWNSRADTLASIATFFEKSGWRRGGAWATEVFVPSALDRERVRNLTPVAECQGMNWRHSRWISVGEWKKLGLVPVGLNPLPGDDVLATLIEPDGPGTGGYLTYGNYRAVMRYNCTNFYSLSVVLLADGIARP